MDIKKWLIEDFKKDINKIKHNPELFTAHLFFLIVGGFLMFLGWDWMHLPSPPVGYEYVTDYHFQGVLLFVVGLVFIGICLLILSQMKVKDEKK